MRTLHFPLTIEAMKMAVVMPHGLDLDCIVRGIILVGMALVMDMRGKR